MASLLYLSIHSSNPLPQLPFHSEETIKELPFKIRPPGKQNNVK